MKYRKVAGKLERVVLVKLFAFLAGVAFTIFNLLVLPIVVDDVTYGRFSLAIFTVNILNTLLIFGANSSFNRIYASANSRSDRDKVISHFRTFGIIQLVLTLAIWTIVALTTDNLFSFWAIILLITLCSRLTDELDFTGRNLSAELFRFLPKFPIVASAVIAFFAANSVVSSSALFAQSLLFIALALLIVVASTYAVQPNYSRISTAYLKKMLAFGLPISIGFLIASITSITVRTLIQQNLGYVEQGYFGLASQIFLLPVVLAGYFLVIIERKCYDVYLTESLNAVLREIAKFISVYVLIYASFGIILWSLEGYLHRYYFPKVSVDDLQTIFVSLFIFGIFHAISMPLSILAKVLNKNTILLTSNSLIGAIVAFLYILNGLEFDSLVAYVIMFVGLFLSRTLLSVFLLLLAMR